MFSKEQSSQEKKFRVPAPRAKAVELLSGRVSEEEREIMLSDGQKKFVHLCRKGGGLLKVIDKKEWAGVLNHSLLVYRVAGFLAQELKKRGMDIDVKRVSEGALLHDVAKRAEDENTWYGLSDKNTEHAKLAAKWLREEEFDEEMARSVEIHYFPDKNELEEFENSWTKKLIFYADLRARGKLVSLEDRFDCLKEKYADTGKVDKERFAASQKLAQQIEREIFEKLDNLQPQDINDLPAPGMERYIRLLVKKGLEERGIKFFKLLYKED